MKIQFVHACIAGAIAISSCWSLGASASPETAASSLAAPDRAAGLLKAAREATARFHDIENAKAAGYGLFLGCVSGHDEGAMGVHYVNLDYVNDPALDATKPEALIYESVNGRMQLIAVEFVVIAEAWDTANPDVAPVLMGQSFQYTESPNRYRLPAFYDLHVWAWKDNPNGTYVEFNPDVSCEDYNPD
jgi:hypothetical protein